MAVAKRQIREKPMKIEERKVRGLEWAPQVKQAAPLAGPIYIGQAWGEGKKHIKRGTKIEPRASLLFVCFGSAHPQSSRVYYPFFSLIKLSYNTGQSVASNFCCSKTELRKLYTPPTYMLLWLTFNLVQTTSAQPPRGRGQTAEARLGESSHGGSWMWRKPSTVEVTRSLVCWKPGQQKQMAESSRGSFSHSRRPPVGVGSPHPYGWKDVWLTKSQFLYSLSFLVSSNPPWTGEWQWVQLRDFGRSYLVAVAQSRWGFFCP